MRRGEPRVNSFFWNHATPRARRHHGEPFPTLILRKKSALYQRLGWPSRLHASCPRVPNRNDLPIRHPRSAYTSKRLKHAPSRAVGGANASNDSSVLTRSPASGPKRGELRGASRRDSAAGSSNRRQIAKHPNLLNLIGSNLSASAELNVVPGAAVINENGLPRAQDRQRREVISLLERARRAAKSARRHSKMLVNRYSEA
jgi:hypothetical protein